MRKFFIVFFVLVLSLPSFALVSYTMSLSEQQLQQQLNQLQQQQYQDGFLTVNLKQPAISLSSHQDKLALTGLVETLFLGSLKANANFKVLGKIKYQAEQGAFYLYDLELESLASEQIPSQYIDKIKGAVSQLLNQVLEDQPVYTLNDADLQEKLAKASLKQVEVKEGKLQLTFSAF